MIKYNQATKRGRTKAALLDAFAYINNASLWAKLINTLRDIRDHDHNGRVTRKTLNCGYLYLSFAGLHGAPARALMVFAWRGRNHYLKQAL